MSDRGLVRCTLRRPDPISCLRYRKNHKGDCKMTNGKPLKAALSLLANPSFLDIMSSACVEILELAKEPPPDRPRVVRCYIWCLPLNMPPGAWEQPVDYPEIEAGIGCIQVVGFQKVKAGEFDPVKYERIIQDHTPASITLMVDFAFMGKDLVISLGTQIAREFIDRIRDGRRFYIHSTHPGADGGGEIVTEKPATLADRIS